MLSGTLLSTMADSDYAAALSPDSNSVPAGEFPSPPADPRAETAQTSDLHPPPSSPQQPSVPPTPPYNASGGLELSCWQMHHDVSALPASYEDLGPPSATAFVEQIDSAADGRDFHPSIDGVAFGWNYACRVRGAFVAPATGIATFTSRSDDGSRVYLGQLLSDGHSDDHSDAGGLLSGDAPAVPTALAAAHTAPLSVTADGIDLALLLENDAVHGEQSRSGSARLIGGRFYLLEAHCACTHQPCRRLEPSLGQCVSHTRIGHSAHAVGRRLAATSTLLFQR